MPTPSSAKSALIKAQNISVQRNGKHILDQVSLDIAPGEFVTLVGPNGAGKSMLIKCLLGIFKPDKGRLIRQPHLQTGYVPQRLPTEPSLPISVANFLQLRTFQANTKRTQLAKLATETQISPLMDKPLNTLSGGEMQRVLLARALRNTPDLLVLDEPTQNLDVSGQLAFYQLIERIFEQRQLAVLMVSHDLHWVMASTQKVVCLYHHVCCSGAPQTVAQHPDFIQLFGQELSTMMAAYPHRHDHHHQH